MKNLLHKKIIILSLGTFLFLILNVGLVSAQLPLGAGINVSTSPSIPQPNEKVIIEIESFSVDLNQATISWYVNGSLKTQGKARKTFELQAGSIGSTQTVDISINTPSFGVVERKVLISPASIDIVEQSDSYTPPFYRGKALTPSESNVTLVAIPSFVVRGSRTPSSNIIFTWKQKGKVLGSLSGLGKNTLTIKGPRIKEESMTIEVEGKIPGEAVRAFASYIVSPSDADIILYEDNPLTGVNLNKSVEQNYSLTKDEISLVAYPYFFSSESTENDDLIYTWTLNSKIVSPTSGSKNTLTLRKGEESGISNISLSITNTKKLFQEAREDLRIQFGKKEAGINFGF